MSFPTLSVYKDLIAAFPSWSALCDHLVGESCRLRVDDLSLPDSPFALIRYVKGQSVLSNPVVRAFRSVVWDTMAHRPVSVTSWKSADGESVPTMPLVHLGSPEYTLEMFNDGILIGMFWDSYNGKWRIHTRSILDARCRYFSATRTFEDMFWEAARDFDLSVLDRSHSYSCVLQHPENRIVCRVSTPRVNIVDDCTIDADSTISWERPSVLTVPTITGLVDWDAVRARIAEWNTRFRHDCQGIVIKHTYTGQRWKLRTPEYNRIRLLRGNSPRRDYMWLKAWTDGSLRNYLALFPEERRDADGIVNRWKQMTADVYRLYGEAFKGRSLSRSEIHPKYRPFVYGLHSLFVETLKPAGKVVDWKTCLEFMNTKDVAQMLYAINWELRIASRGTTSIPIEHASTIGTSVDATPHESKIESTGGTSETVEESVTV
jgi:hypothetical protein